MAGENWILLDCVMSEKSNFIRIFPVSVTMY